jgi:hypothetical protein
MILDHGDVRRYGSRDPRGTQLRDRRRLFERKHPHPRPLAPDALARLGVGAVGDDHLGLRTVAAERFERLAEVREAVHGRHDDRQRRAHLLASARA